MTNSEFKVGERVRMKRNGVSMTVFGVLPPFFQFRYQCTWVDDEGTTQHEDFQLTEIELLTAL